MVKPPRRGGSRGRCKAVGGSRAAPKPKPKSSGGPWLWGRHPVVAALANPRRRIDRLLVTEEAAADLPPLPAGVAAERTTRADLSRLLPEGAVHQGLALAAPPLPEVFVEDIEGDCADDPAAVVLLLDRAQDPRNVGAVLRSAAAFGARAVILPKHHAPEATGVLAKAASGALEQVPLIHAANIVRALETLKRAGFWGIGLDGAAETPLPAADLDSRVVLVLGAEGAGLRRTTRAACDLLVRIPISRAMESLNLSNAAAVCLYEIARRRSGQ